MGYAMGAKRLTTRASVEMAQNAAVDRGEGANKQEGAGNPAGNSTSQIELGS